MLMKFILNDARARARARAFLGKRQIDGFDL